MWLFRYCGPSWTRCHRGTRGRGRAARLGDVKAGVASSLNDAGQLSGWSETAASISALASASMIFVASSAASSIDFCRSATNSSSASAAASISALVSVEGGSPQLAVNSKAVTMKTRAINVQPPVLSHLHNWPPVPRWRPMRRHSGEVQLCRSCPAYRPACGAG